MCVGPRRGGVEEAKALVGEETERRRNEVLDGSGGANNPGVAPIIAFAGCENSRSTRQWQLVSPRVTTKFQNLVLLTIIFFSCEL